mmetsp:Transcript_39503/g.70069  ORF Transcript_39503/g.70069 Transcript_39503/m.70069 type:complete len:166 (+) Transcript_39503:1-498(+)
MYAGSTISELQRAFFLKSINAGALQPRYPPPSVTSAGSPKPPTSRPAASRAAASGRQPSGSCQMAKLSTEGLCQWRTLPHMSMHSAQIASADQSAMLKEQGTSIRSSAELKECSALVAEHGDPASGPILLSLGLDSFDACILLCKLYHLNNFTLAQASNSSATFN